jgi:DNA (cytosine-5)-methyltransferase 1
MRSIEIFAGAGGLAMGMSNAGFKHAAVIEWNHDACETFRENQRLHACSVDRWPVYEIDARLFDYTSLKGEISVVSGGPPCQPFSAGGKHQGYSDSRNMFPEALRAIRELQPKAFIFENVKGLTRKKFSEYYSYICLQLQYPEVLIYPEESWAEHKVRLDLYNSSNWSVPTYNVVCQLLNSADYGVPQKRERIFFVGFRSDLGVQWSFPIPTHSRDLLLYSKWVSGEYWEELGLKKAVLDLSIKEGLLRRVLLANDLGKLKRWRTTRDALVGLPDPEVNIDNTYPNHIHIPGARSYKGHTGSLLDEPSKTLKAGSHGVPGGENMMIKDDCTVRYFTVREAARLQTFPDEYEFHGSWGQAMKQLGNAVPVTLAEVIARSVVASLISVKPHSEAIA